MNINETKTEWNRESESATRSLLQAKSWPEKIRSIERMNRAKRIAQQAMKDALAHEASAS